MLTGNAAALPDETIVQRVLNGEPELFELLMRRYNRRLFRVAMATLGDRAEAEDLLQEAYVRGYTNLAQCRAPGNVAGWLTAIVVHEAYARSRKERREPALADVFEDERASEQIMSTRSDPEQLAAVGEVRRVLEAAIEALPQDYRAAFVLREVECLGVGEIAECLGISEMNVRTRVHRARVMMYRYISREVGGSLTSVYPFAGETCDRLAARVLETIAG